MTVQDAISLGVAELTERSESPLLDALLLLGIAEGKTKEMVLASYPDAVPGTHFQVFKDLLQKRAAGYPVSYLQGKKEFYGLRFVVGKQVLVPRPDTEILVEAVFNLCRLDNTLLQVHDCCTGSGNIAIALKFLLPNLRISASDVSKSALNTMKQNSLGILNQELPAYHSDLFDGIQETFDLIVANPPYVTSGYVKQMVKKGLKEPIIALDGGELGVEFSEKLVQKSIRRLRPGGYLLLEIDPSGADLMKKIFVQNGYTDIILYRDLANRLRVIQGTLN